MNGMKTTDRQRESGRMGKECDDDAMSAHTRSFGRHHSVCFGCTQYRWLLFSVAKHAFDNGCSAGVQGRSGAPGNFGGNEQERRFGGATGGKACTGSTLLVARNTSGKRCWNHLDFRRDGRSRDNKTNVPFTHESKCLKIFLSTTTGRDRRFSCKFQWHPFPEENVNKSCMVVCGGQRTDLMI